MRRREHLLAHLLSLQHQPVSGRATAILRWRRSSPTHTDRRFITLRTVLQIDHAQFPLPLVHRTDGVEKLLLLMKSKVTHLLGPGFALEAVELLPMNPECVAGSRFPAEDSVKNFVELVQPEESGTATSRMTMG